MEIVTTFSSCIKNCYIYSVTQYGSEIMHYKVIEIFIYNTRTMRMTTLTTLYNNM